MEEITSVDIDKKLEPTETSTKPGIDVTKSKTASVQLEEGKRKLDDFLESREITLSEYLDPDSHELDFSADKVDTLGDIDSDVLIYLLSEYFKPVSREGRPGFPPIPEGHVRLFRGEQARGEDEDVISLEGQGRWWTQFLDIAADYAEGDEGRIYFLDVPEDIAQRSVISRLHETLDRPVGGSDAFIFEFYIPLEYVDGEKGTQNVLTALTVEGLLKQGEFTRFGVHLEPNDEYEDLTDTQKERRDIRGKLIDLSAEATLSFWDSYKYEHDSDFRQQHPDAENYTKPKSPNSVESAEYLLAKVSGWK